MIDFKIRRGLSTVLFDESGELNKRLIIEEGCWYLCTDTAELFLGVLENNELTLKPINGSTLNRPVLSPNPGENEEPDDDFSELQYEVGVLQDELTALSASLVDYAKKTEIPDTSAFIREIPAEFITESELDFANQDLIEDLIKVVDDKVKALDDTYATDAEVEEIRKTLAAATQKVADDLATYELANNAKVKALEDSLAEGGATANAIAAAQKTADDITTYVGTFTHDTAKTVVEYVNEKTAGIATDANLQILEGRLNAIENAETGILASAKSYVDAEDTFEIDMLTVNAHGGIAAGTDLNGLRTHEILKKILYPYVEPTLGNATASPNGGTYEKGVTKTITSVSITITKKSEAITSVALYNGSTLIEEKTGDAVKNGGTITFSNVNVEVPTTGNQLTVKVTDAANKTYDKKTSSMTFVYPYYMGSCAAGTTIDETLVESLTKKVESKGNKSNSFTVSDGHMVFAYPKAHGVLKSILDPNNFETIGNYTRSEVSVTGLDGTAQAYYVYVSGATTVSGFTVNFKY